MGKAPDARDLERKVKEVYRDVATAPDREYHFEMGRGLAERLGYPPADLDRVPSEAIDSFAGVGYHFDLAAISEGARVLDLGSGTGMDAFVAALYAGLTGRVVGIDMTVEQLTKSRRLRDRDGFHTVSFKQGYIEELPFENDTFDVVLSNGAINLSTRKGAVFREASRVLKHGGRLAISEVISEEELPERIKANADLWVACIGGAMQATAYMDSIEAAGLEIVVMRENSRYEFLTNQARTACSTYGVKSASLAARNR